VSVQSSDLQFVHGEGGHCWDADGRRYLDLVCGYGPVILGHGHKGVACAVAKQMKEGLLFPGKPRISNLAEILDDVLGRPRTYHICKTGSEAIAAAVRLARAFTDRPLVVRCGFHGWHDAFISPDCSWHDFEPPRSTGREVLGLSSAPSGVLKWDGQEIYALETLISTHPGHIAAVVIDPVQVREPCGLFLAELRALTARHGVLLILDELKTGFRVALDGVDGLFGVNADMVIYGKAIANGMPLAVIAGPAEIIGLAPQCRLKGTFSNELASISAACATLHALQAANAPALLNSLGAALIEGLNEQFRRGGVAHLIEAVPYRWPCMPFLLFRGDALHWKDRFYSLLTKHGVLMLPRHMNYLCCAHDDADVRFVAATVGESLAELDLPFAQGV
jgi:glutamate-1-semialdehyde 2,1-aminomutase